MKLIKGATVGGVRPINREAIDRVVSDTNNTYRLMSEAQAQIQAASAPQPMSLGERLKSYVSMAKSFGKQAYIEILKGGVKTGLTVKDALSQNRNPLSSTLSKPSGTTVNVYGQPVQSFQSDTVRAGEQYRAGEITGKQAAGQVASSALDVISTVYAPGKIFKTFKGGKIARGVLEGGAVTGVFGAGYGAAHGAQENMDATGILKEAAKSAAYGAIGGSILGGVFAGAGSAISKVLARRKELLTPKKEGELPPVVDMFNKPSNPVDYIASRPNLKIIEVPKIADVSDGGTVESRLEWDDAKGRGVVMMTPNADENSVAHLIGNYIDKNYPEFKQEFRDEVVALTGGKNTPEQDLANAIKRILTEPGGKDAVPKLAKALEKAGIDLSGKAQEKASQKVYRGREVGVDESGAPYRFFSESKDQAAKYGEIKKSTDGKSEVIEEDITGKRFKEVSPGDYLTAVEDKKILAEFDGVKFKEPDGKMAYALFTKKKPSSDGLPKKKSGYSKSLEAKAVEKDLAKAFDDGELAEYTPAVRKEQAEMATELINTDMQKVIDILDGNAPLPKGLRGASLALAVERHALRNNDATLIKKLAASDISTLISEAGSELSMLAGRNADSPVRIIKQIMKARAEGAKKRVKKGDMGTARKQIKSDIKKRVKREAPTKESWSSFIKEIEC